MFRTGIARSISLAMGLLLVTACAPFAPILERTEPAAESPKKGIPFSYLTKGLTVELEGRLERGAFTANRIEIEEPDDEVTLKGFVEQWSDTRGVIGGVTFRLDDRTVLFDEEKRKLATMPLGVFVKAEASPRGGVLTLRKATVRNHAPDQPAELQGEIERIRPQQGRLVIAGIPVTYGPDTVIAWDVEGQEPPNFDDLALGLAPPDPTSRLRQLHRIDDDDERPEDQLRIGESITIGGEVQYELEWRNNFDLRDMRERDRLIHDLSLKLEFEFDINRHVFGFVQLRGHQEIVHFDQENDEDTFHRGEIGEAWVLFEDLPIDGLGVQIGRQDFDHGREWVMDADLDAVRVFFNLDPILFEAAIGTVLFDTTPEEEGITNFLAGARYRDDLGDPEVDAYLWYLHRKDGELDLSRNHVGLSLEVATSDVTFWMDVATQFGHAQDRRVRGYGLDLMMLYEPSLPLNPYVYAGFAMGSGDRSTTGTDGNFRQTGLHDNNDRLGGVTSFRYLGELFRPELSNLRVTTFGIGIRPIPDASLDLVYHHYAQVEPTRTLPDSRLRLNPTGLDRDLGSEVDLILGLKTFSPVEVELVMSWFHPGQAYVAADDAWFINLQVEWNF